MDGSNIEHFLFYFENVAEPNAEGEKKARALIKYLRGAAFQFFYEQFAEIGELSTEGRSNEHVKAILRGQFGMKKDPACLIDYALSLKLGRNEPLKEFVETMRKAYDAAGLTDELKFVFLSKAALTFDDIRNFVVQRAPKTFTSLQDALLEYHHSFVMFKQILESRNLIPTKGVRRGGTQERNRDSYNPKTPEDLPSVEELSSKLAELSLLVKRQSSKTPGGFGQASSMNGNRIAKGGSCSYCGKNGHAIDDCWKREREQQVCSYCIKQGYDISSCWSREGHNRSNNMTDRQGQVNVMQVDEDDLQSDSIHEEIAAIKRGRDGEPLSKQRNLREVVEEDIEPSALKAVEKRTQAAKSTEKKGVPSKQRKKRPEQATKYLAERVEHYDLLSSLAQAETGINIGQLLRGDAREAEAVARRISRERTGKKVLAALERESGAGERTVSQHSNEDHKRLKLVEVEVFGTTVRTLLDSGAVPNVMSADLCHRLHLEPHKTNRRMRMADGTEAGVVGEVTNVSITVGDLTCRTAFLVVERAPFNLIIGRPAMKHMKTSLDFDKDIAVFRGDEKIVTLPLWTDGEENHNDLSEEFTSDEEGYEASQSTSDCSEGGGDVDECGPIGEEYIVCLEEVERGTNGDELIIAWNLDELRPSEVPYSYAFQLNVSTPICPPLRRLPERLNKVVKDEIDVMLRANIIKPANSRWGFPVVIARKKDGTPRFCVDYRTLNKRMKADKYPIPNIKEVLDDLEGVTVFSKLDMFAGYWQVRLAEHVQKQSTFRCKYGSYQFQVMPFGLINAPAMFQRMASTVFRDLSFVKVYIDDVVVGSRHIDEHIGHLVQVCNRIRKSELKVKLSKCEFAQKCIEVLGYVVSTDGLEADPDKVACVANARLPLSRKELRSFLMFCSFNRRFIPGFSNIAAPLHEMAGQESNFEWTQETMSAFQDLKTAMSQPPVLALPNMNNTIHVFTDASKHALGAALMQKDDRGCMKAVHFASRCWNKCEKSYSTFEREAAAIIFALKKYRHYLLSGPFIVYNDNKALKTAFEKSDLHGRLARWLDLMAEYEFQIQHIDGRRNVVADYLSRCKGEEADDEEETNLNIDRLLLHEGKEIKSLKESVALATEDVDLEDFLHVIKAYIKTGNGIRVPVRLRRQAKSYDLFQEHLMRTRNNGPKLVPNFQQRERILNAMHNETGHWGFQTSLRFVANSFWWPTMRKDVSTFVKTCHDGQLGSQKPRQLSVGRQPVSGIFGPFSVDFAGPLSVTDRGNRFIIVAVEHLSRWLLAKALPSQTADVAVRFFPENILANFGSPRTVLSDQGPAFTSGSWRSTVQRTGTDAITTAAYTPQSNGRVEKMVQTIKRAVTRCINDSGRPWNEVLDDEVNAYNIRAARDGYSPYQLLYGVQPSEVGRHVASCGEQIGNLEINISLQEEQERTRRYVQVITSHAIRATHAVQRHPLPETPFKSGDRVMVSKPYHHSKALGFRWMGPCTVTKIRGARCDLVDNRGKRSRTAIHSSRLLKYHDREGQKRDEDL